MGERYQILTRKNEQIRTEGCPVSIEAYAVLFDNETQQKLLQVKLQNHSALTVSSCTISISAEDEEIIPKHTFEGLTAKARETFGSKSPVQLPGYAPDDVIPSVISVLFENGSEWKNISDEPLPDLTAEDEPPDLDQPDETETALPLLDEPEKTLPERSDLMLPLQEGITTAVPEPAKTKKKKAPMIIAIAGVIVAGLVLFFLFGWKSQAVRDTQKLIRAIETPVTYESKAAVEEAEKAYSALSDKEKNRVSNYDDLVAKRSQLDIAAEEYYRKTKVELATKVKDVARACIGIWYSDILVIQTVGAEYIDTVRSAMKLFKEDKPLSSYDSEARSHFWITALGIAPSYLSGTTLKAGKENDLLRECILYNKEWEMMETITSVKKEVDAFVLEFSDAHPEETNLLGTWTASIESTRNYLLSPSTSISLSDSASTLSKVIEITGNACEAFGVDYEDDVLRD